ncbi:MAG: aspartate dehydrogenase [Pseudomonadota bacterium]|nr:aspartate dehydrogenase [Pseudomonadota bacterium]
MAGSEMRLVLVGWGAITRRVAGLLAERAAPVRVVAVAVRDRAAVRAQTPPSARMIADPAELADLSADFVVEAASRASVAPWARAALGLGLPIAVSSTSAFAAPELLPELVALARRTGGAVLIPPGALGGIDALAAAGRLGLASVTHEIVKPPAAWRGTAAETLCDLERLAAPAVLFEGSAAEAAAAFPQNANVALITALAGLGPERTRLRLVADPAATLNGHRIHAEGDFGRLDIRLENRPLAANPKSSELTALNLVRLIENQFAPLRV